MPDPADPPSEEPPFRPVVALSAIARRWDEELSAALREEGLTIRTYGLLGHIRRTPGISFSELGRRSRITVQSAHTAVRTLVDGGLVSDATGQAGSTSHLSVTAAGERVMALAAARMDVLDARFVQEHEALTAGLREETSAMWRREKRISAP